VTLAGKNLLISDLIQLFFYIMKGKFQICRLLISLVLILSFSSCKTSNYVIKKLESNGKVEQLNINLTFRGKKINPSKITTELVRLITSNNINNDLYYNISYGKWIFSVNEEYLKNSKEVKIEFDNKLIGNKVKKELPNERLHFIRKYFILDTGEDDIYLIPVIKN